MRHRHRLRRLSLLSLPPRLLRRSPPPMPGAAHRLPGANRVRRSALGVSLLLPVQQQRPNRLSRRLRALLLGDRESGANPLAGIKLNLVSLVKIFRMPSRLPIPWAPGANRPSRPLRPPLLGPLRPRLPRPLPQPGVLPAPLPPSPPNPLGVNLALQPHRPGANQLLPQPAKMFLLRLPRLLAKAKRTNTVLPSPVQPVGH